MIDISNTIHSNVTRLEDLNLIDAFLFQEATANPVHAKMIAQIIIRRALGIELGDAIVEVEKPMNGYTPDKHGLRMDICVSEFNSPHNPSLPSRLFKIEHNKYRETDLPRRSRYSTSLLDAKILPTNTPFSLLPNIFSIWILPYDPFGENRMIYTVKNMVVENSNLEYNDGITKIFLCINGSLGGTKELADLLHYFSHSTLNNANDKELIEIQHIIDEIKHNEKAGERYMRFVTYEEYIEMAKEHGYITGYESGYDSGVKAFITALKSSSFDQSQVKEALINHYNLSSDKADKYLDLYW